MKTNAYRLLTAGFVLYSINISKVKGADIYIVA